MTALSSEQAYDVEFRAVTKRFGSLTAVNAVTLKVRKGEFLSLLGPSGCGKTTSLRLIAGFEQPDEGEILIGGMDAASAAPYKRDVNTVFQHYALFPHMSVLDNVAYGLKQRKVGRAQRHARASCRAPFDVLVYLTLVVPEIVIAVVLRRSRVRATPGQEQTRGLGTALGMR